MNTATLQTTRRPTDPKSFFSVRITIGVSRAPKRQVTETLARRLHAEVSPRIVPPSDSESTGVRASGGDASSQVVECLPLSYEPTRRRQR